MGQKPVWRVSQYTKALVLVLVVFVTSTQAQAQSITTGDVDTDALAGDMDTDGAVTADKIADNAITADKIDGNLKLTGNDLNRILKDYSLKREDMVSDPMTGYTSYGARDFAAGTKVANNQLQDGVVRRIDKMGDGSTDDIVAGAVDSTKIRDRNIGDVHIADDAVTLEKLASADRFVDHLNEELEAGLMFLTDEATRTAAITYSAPPEGDTQRAAVEGIVADVLAGKVLDVTEDARFDMLIGTNAQAVLELMVTREVAARRQLGSVDDLAVVIPTAAPGATPGETEEAKRAAYRAGSLRAQARYLAGRIGLDPAVGVSGAQGTNTLQEKTNLLSAEFGERTDQIGGGSAAPTSAIDETAYQGASVGARANYLADRIGLNSGAAGVRDGTLTEQSNYLRDKTGADDDIIDGLTEGDVETVSQSDYRDATVHARANYLADRIGLDPNVEGDKTGSLTARLNYLDDEIGGDEDKILVPVLDVNGDEVVDVNGVPVRTAISDDDINDDSADSRANALDLEAFLKNNLNARANWFAARVGLNRDVAGKRNGNLQAQNNWVSDEIGRSANYIPTHNGFAAAQNALDIADYQDSTVRAQHNYWRDRIGLDPNALPNRYGRVQEQVNWLIEQADRIQRATAMTGSLRDAHIPPGHRGGASFTFADYNGDIGYSLSLASIMGTRSKMTMSFASTENTEESLFRFGYDISW